MARQSSQRSGSGPSARRGSEDPEPSSTSAFGGIDPMVLFQLQMLNEIKALAEGDREAFSSNVVLPPVLELLAESRARRSDYVDQTRAALPNALEFYLGYEPNGVYDALLGMIGAGAGPRGTPTSVSGIPVGARRVQRQPLEQPSLSEDLPEAQALAAQIMQGLQVIPTGGSRPTGQNPEIEAAIAALLPQILDAIVGGSTAGASAAPAQPAAPTDPFEENRRRILEGFPSFR